MFNFYGKYVFPWLLDWTLRGEVFSEQRRRLLADAAGEVIEIGFGTGLNLPHYGPAVSRLTAVEPARMLSKRVQRRIDSASFPTERITASAELLPLAEASFDCAVTTWTLCSVRDVAAALGELRRVLRPGGKLLFMEHGLSDDPRIAAWQHRLTPFARLMACGCHLDRPIGALIESAQLATVQLERFVLRGESPIVGQMYAGVARKE